MSEFKIPPISTIIGGTFTNNIKLLTKNKVDKAYALKAYGTALITLLISPFHWYERYHFDQVLQDYRLSSPPLFILGHWRSGTTHLHNLLSQDPRAGYLTTYQSVFPNNLSSKSIFRTFMRLNMPDKRPGDNVRLGINLPQEDEFALGNMNPHAYYNFFYFPREYARHYRESVRFELSEKDIRQWKADYRRLIYKAAHDTNCVFPIVKNPVNTGRIPTLLEMFPNANFVHIHRNPVIVYLSTKNFFTQLMPTLQLQHFGEAEISDMIVEVYDWLMHAIMADRRLIPKAQYFEFAFDDLENQPKEILSEIYDRFALGGFSSAWPHFETYLKQQRSYRKNKHTITRGELDTITSRWGFAMREFGYGLPDSIEVV